MAALAENVAKVVAAHAALKAAIAAKGVTVPDGAKLSDMAGLVEGIEADTAHAVPTITFNGEPSGAAVISPVVKCDLTRVASVSNCFGSCSGLISLDLGANSEFGANATVQYSPFSGLKSLENLTGAIKIKSNFRLSDSTKLTHDSLMNVINGLVTVSSGKTLWLGGTNIAKLTADEIAVATAKGWTIA